MSKAVRYKRYACVKAGRKCTNCRPSSSSPNACQNFALIADEEESSRMMEHNDIDQPNAANIEPISETLDEWIARRHTNIRCLKRIPLASRHLVASKLASILNSIVDKNDLQGWTALIEFPCRFLSVPTRGGHRRTLASCINRCLGENEDLPLSILFGEKHPQPPRSASRPHSTILPSRVTSKLEEGDYRGAVRLACSEESLAVIDDNTLASLRKKHPSAHPNASPPQPPGSSNPIETLTETEVRSAILSFPNGSAGGPDGLRPQYLKDLTCSSAGMGGRDLISSLLNFANMAIKGNIPTMFQSSFFGASLIVLNKRDGGIRPIAVGNTLRRLVAKCLSAKVRQEMSAHLQPLQLGYGIPGGAEAIAHTIGVS